MPLKPRAVSAAFVTLAFVGALAGLFAPAAGGDDAKVLKKEASPSGAAVKKEDLRYDRKPFEYWRRYLLTELKAERRIEALTAMAAFGAKGYGKEAVPAILEIVKDYSPDLLRGVPPGKELEQRVLETAHDAAEKIGPPGFALFVKGLEERNLNVRFFCTHVLYCEISKTEVPALLELTLKKNVNIRDAAVLVLGNNMDKKAVRAAWLHALREDEKATKVIAALIEAYKHDRRPEQRPLGVMSTLDAAAILLGHVGPRAKAAVPVLVNSLAGETTPYFNADDGWCDHSLDALKAIGATPAAMVSALIKRFRRQAAATETELVDRTFIVKALGDIGPPAKDALPLLKEALQDKRPPLSEAAEAAVKKIEKQ